MFRHLFIKNLKMLVKDKQLMFWLLMFPIVLSTLFYVAFSGLGEAESFQKIPVAVVYEQEDAAFREAVGSADSLFIVTEVAADEALSLLQKGEVKAVLTAGGTLKLTVAASGYEQTVVKSFADAYLRTVSAVGGVVGAGGTDLNQIIADLSAQAEDLSVNAAAGRKNDNIVIYYFALVGMACFMFAMAGQNVINMTQPNQTDEARRVSIGPTRRTKLFLAATAAHLVMLVAVLAVILAYLMLVLRIDLGGRIGLILLTVLGGMLTGFSFGLFLGALFKKKMGVKIGVTVGLTMLMSMLSGMMYAELKYIVIRAAPPLQYLNPLGLISDCLYTLYYYQNIGRFWLYGGILLSYAVVFTAAALLLIRRKQYASI